jgi:hypothetical protein
LESFTRVPRWLAAILTRICPVCEHSNDHSCLFGESLPESVFPADRMAEAAKVYRIMEGIGTKSSDSHGGQADNIGFMMYD